VCQQELLIRPSAPLQSDPLVHPHLHPQFPVCLPVLGLTMILTTVEIVSGKKTVNVPIVNVNAKYGIDNVRSASEIASAHQ